MKATTEVEVIPIWFIEKWKKENCHDNSALAYWIEKLLKVWKIEEKQNEHRTGDSSAD